MNRLPLDPAAGRRLLVVDDDARNRFALGALLGRAGYRVLSAEDGAQALQVLQSESGIGLVVMDLMMPVMDGAEATRRLRAIPVLARLPVIALTADALPGTRDYCLAAGCTDYLAKPVDNRELLARIEYWLQPA